MESKIVNNKAIIKKLKPDGFLWFRIKRKSNKILECLFSHLLKKCKLRKVIILNSHNDFDMNAGALYEYMIKKEINKKYKIVWLVKTVQKRSLPNNVFQCRLLAPSLRKYYWRAVAKYIFYEDAIISKWRSEQVEVYLGHATRAMKNCRGLVASPKTVDFVCSSSDFNDELMSDIYCCDINKMFHVGFPVNDCLFQQWNELEKLQIKGRFNNVVIWMPTFRKSASNSWRNDSALKTETGLPLVNAKNEYNVLNDFLCERNIILIIKFHPVQDMAEINLPKVSNILPLSANDLKKYQVNSYKLLTQTDALISDYSSISFDYLLLDKPIAYVLSDEKEYKLGFAVDNPKDFMPGDYIYNLDDFMRFIKSVNEGEDPYREKRNELKDKIHAFQDGRTCERIVKKFGLID